MTIKEYMSHIKNVRRYSHHTLLAYKTDLNQFEEFCKQDLLIVTRKDVRKYLLYLKDLGYSNRTINRKLEVLRSFYRYNWWHYKISSPCNLLPPIRFQKAKSTYLSAKEIANVLDNIVPGQNRKIMRDLVILEILYHTGCRADEILNLKKKYVDINRLQIKIIGKGKVERIVPVNKRIVTMLKIYLKMWQGKNKGAYVFVNDKGKKIYPMFLWRLIRKYFDFEQLGIAVSAHTFRHSTATHLHHNRAPIKSIKDLLGHRSLRSTTVYLHSDTTKMLEIYNLAHPRAKTLIDNESQMM